MLFSSLFCGLPTSDPLQLGLNSEFASFLSVAHALGGQMCGRSEVCAEIALDARSLVLTEAQSTPKEEMRHPSAKGL
eukprot:4502158-Amphidinium_carterae.1